MGSPIGTEPMGEEKRSLGEIRSGEKRNISGNEKT